ncbi:MAG: hypothetical protein COY38_04335 [Candidatus Aenigmarchaeota archaeon CG_4_10_14_0_8_um_filter_37_24]|nr:hypothetical protein [Candidatus Aenigmarchaeota archaeon]OIN87899.1 MAG: hypothetical protein AUJ50_02200 [Candidatus Aenigmarchaeota archaeon CG1_02_38_14]PIV68592.1 MAG: hypothetical protein COS07_03605 [Candidatus Aenigmarchaeota archaeon CG01_land_8_20_14_3_00_37_9]PIW41596.1 MAG: hypothetical protein COW21_01065 [Candidatus Aenigmarchaeota archaeon CG15_BIG_FIL_POST_REV_8_21_14_020_37_27]PIX51198.1 MAG: hypothetical protein COZ52_00180 [Candidatus Aenigmarchaeota archaeon CG_4_8_14_3_u
MIMEDDEIKGKILDKMARHRYWGGKHTDTLNLAKGFPKDIRKYVLKLVDEMKNDNLIISKPTSYGEHVSLNIERKDEIQFLIDKFLVKKY